MNFQGHADANLSRFRSDSDQRQSIFAAASALRSRSSCQEIYSHCEDKWILSTPWKNMASRKSKSDMEREKVIQNRLQELLKRMIQDEDNKYCVDCDAKGIKNTLGDFLKISFVYFKFEKNNLS